MNIANGRVFELTDIKGARFREAYAITAVAGRFAVVVNTNDCLNVRESPGPGGPVLGCFKDGTLLKDLAEIREEDGISWLNVATPQGREGWAALAYLDR